MAGAAVKREHAEDAEETTKRQRTEKAAEEMTPEQVEKIQSVLAAVAVVNEELEKHSDKMNKEILKIEAKCNQVKRPAFEKRDKLFLDIPNFWKQALVNHPLISQVIGEDDEKILDYLKNLDVTFTDDLGSFKVHLNLNENPFLSSLSLWKNVQVLEDDEAEPVITAAELKWIESDEAKEVADNASFFEWFASTEGAQEMVEVIKDDLYMDPVQFYADDDDDESGDDEDEEGDDEEGEGEDEAEE